MTHRVVQWTTGNVGRPAVEAVVANPELDLVGCYVWSADKVGRDVGELCGIGTTGVLATNDVGELLSLEPDCVVYTPKFIDVDEMVRILDSGANIVSTAWFITGHSLGEGRDRLLAACRRGRTSVFGSGSNPGSSDLLALASTTVCDRVDKVTVTQMADATGYDSPDTEMPMGFGRPIDDPELPAMTRAGTAYFVDRVHLMGAALGIELDEVVLEVEYAQTTEDLDLGSWRILSGCVAGMDYRWQGRVSGRTIVEFRSRLIKGRTLDPDWKLERGFTIEVTGRPSVRTRIERLPPPEFKGSTPAEYMSFSMVATAMAAVNAIPAVVAAAPGIVTYLDIPVPTAWGYAST
jgi:hypothetical protein